MYSYFQYEVYTAVFTFEGFTIVWILSYVTLSRNNGCVFNPSAGSTKPLLNRTSFQRSRKRIIYTYMYQYSFSTVWDCNSSGHCCDASTVWRAKAHADFPLTWPYHQTLQTLSYHIFVHLCEKNKILKFSIVSHIKLGTVLACMLLVSDHWSVITSTRTVHRRREYQIQSML